MPIVVGYVDSPEGGAAIEHALREAKLRGTDVVVVHSRRGGFNEDPDRAYAEEQSLARVERELAEGDTETAVRQLVRGNSPAQDLVSVAEEVGAELIVIGLRRRTPVGKLIMGSNAQEILLSAECPVLAVKAPAS